MFTFKILIEPQNFFKEFQKNIFGKKKKFKNISCRKATNKGDKYGQNFEVKTIKMKERKNKCWDVKTMTFQ